LKVRRSINPLGRDGKLPFEGLGRWGVGAISVAAEEKLNSLGCEYEILPSFQFFSPSGWSLKEAK
jgi:large subunit ribosomal protein L15